jgi:hypothetical protein
MKADNIRRRRNTPSIGPIELQKFDAVQPLLYNVRIEARHPMKRL